MENQPQMKNNQDCSTAVNTYNVIHRIELYNAETVLYFDKNWDMQESTISIIANDERFLHDFQNEDVKILSALNEIRK